MNSKKRRTPVEYFEYERTENGVKIKGLKESGMLQGGELRMPDYIEGVPVTVIKERSFVFEDIKVLVLPKKLQEIGQEAFSNSKIKKLVIPGGIKELGRSAFRDCGIKKLIFDYPEGGDTEIYDFFSTSSPYAFIENPIEEIVVRGDNPYIKDINRQGLYSKNGKRLILGVTSGRIEKGTKIIAPCAFKRRGVRAINLPTSIRRIGLESFSYNKLSELEIPEGLKILGTSSFAHNQIEKLKTPKSLRLIKESAFVANKIKTLEMNEGLKEIGDGAFISNKLKKVKLPKTLTRVGAEAFVNNSIEKAIIFESESLSVGPKAFRNNKIEVVFINKEMIEGHSWILTPFSGNKVKKIFISGPLENPIQHYVEKGYLEEVHLEKGVADDVRFMEINEELLKQNDIKVKILTKEEMNNIKNIYQTINV